MKRFLLLLNKKGSTRVVKMQNARTRVVGMDCSACSACDCVCFCDCQGGGVGG
ncbi:hypothetical protein IKG10_01245 [Candidatus Saccharibacteria bacterium]|nr:hypothetical protein [Candidatus Saccharibacteria bacterium]